MKRLFKFSVASFALAATLLSSGNALAFQAPATKDKASKTATKTAAVGAPTEKDIADAKAKGLVWVNTSTKVYHKDGQFYGKTKQGQFMYVERERVEIDTLPDFLGRDFHECQERRSSGTGCVMGGWLDTWKQHMAARRYLGRLQETTARVGSAPFHFALTAGASAIDAHAVAAAEIHWS